MKLIKKLLPLFTIGATAMSVAPIATSCTNERIHIVKFDCAGGTSVADQKIVSGEYAHEPDTQCVGYTIKCWKRGDKVWNFNTDKVEEDITLKAEWVANPLEQLVNLKDYEPSITPHEAVTTAITRGQAAKMYFGNENAARIMVDDLLNYLSKESALLQEAFKEEWVKQILYLLGLDWITGDFEYTGAYIENPVIVYDSSKPEGSEDLEARISGTIILKLKTGVTESGKQEKIGSITLLTKHVLKDVPYSMMQGTIEGESEKHWNTHLDLDKLGTDDKWSIKREYSSTVEYLDATKPSESSTTSEFWYSKNKPTAAQLQFIAWYSTYMWDVKAA